MRKLFVAGSLIVLSLTGAVLAAEPVKSGPQVGQDVGAFEPLNLTGPYAGEEKCLVCANGLNPVVVVFAREVTEPVAKLVKKIDEATLQHGDDRMGSFVVFLTDDGGIKDKAKELLKKEKIKKTVLAKFDPAGPEDYKLSKDAEVTVLLYTDLNVKANYAFKKGELTEKDADKILGDLGKILPKK
jgi:hypothetical protein